MVLTVPWKPIVAVHLGLMMVGTALVCALAAVPVLLALDYVDRGFLGKYEDRIHNKTSEQLTVSAVGFGESLGGPTLVIGAKGGGYDVPLAPGDTATFVSNHERHLSEFMIRNAEGELRTLHRTREADHWITSFAELRPPSEDARQTYDRRNESNSTWLWWTLLLLILPWLTIRAVYQRWYSGLEIGDGRKLSISDQFLRGLFELARDVNQQIGVGRWRASGRS